MQTQMTLEIRHFYASLLQHIEAYQALPPVIQECVRAALKNLSIHSANKEWCQLILDKMVEFAERGVKNTP